MGNVGLSLNSFFRGKKRKRKKRETVDKGDDKKPKKITILKLTNQISKILNSNDPFKKKKNTIIKMS